MTELIDISPPITPHLAVFPGDTPLSREVLLDMQRGDHLTLSSLHATAHLGAHVDGANHYSPDAPGVDGWPLELFIGPCEVVHLAGAAPSSRISLDQLPARFTTPRLLLRTGTFPDPNRWSDGYAALHPEAVDYLAEHGVRLVGIDTPSVDSADAKSLVAHHRFLAHDIAILEGLVLEHVAAGMYELIALPLRLIGFDASPVRAVLRPLHSDA